MTSKSGHHPLRVLYDDEAFVRHHRSGITRYFAELIAEYRRNTSLEIEPLTPFRWVSNEHLIESDAGDFHRIPLPGPWRVPTLGRLNSRSRKTLRDADLVHHSIYEPSALDTWQAPRRVCTIYDFTFEHLPDLFPHAGPQLADKRIFIERCDALICISQTTADDFRVFWPDVDKPVAVAPLGVSAPFFDPRPASIKDLPERYVLHIGNRFEHKNVDVLMRAFAEVSRDDPTLWLVMSGRGAPDESDRLMELGIADRTLRLRATDAQLPWLYHQALAFVFPSIYEGFGLPVLEAMAAGCATVISSAPALLEVADDAAPAVAPDDVNGLADAVRRLVSDPTERERLQELGRQRAAEFTWRRTAEATSRAYREVARTT